MTNWTLFLLMTWNGANYQPAHIQTVVFHSYAECQSQLAYVPKIVGWTTGAFCTPGGTVK